MAWKAYLNVRVAAISPNQILLDLSYYDDTAPGNDNVGPPPQTAPASVLWSTSLAVSADSTNAQLRAAIIAQGQALHAAYDKASTLNSQFPAGSTLAIP